MSGWKLFQTTAGSSLFVTREPHARLRDIAAVTGITERSAHRIVSELVEDGYLVRVRNGRSNHYVVQPDAPIVDPLLAGHWVGELLVVLAGVDHWPRLAPEDNLVEGQ